MQFPAQVRQRLFVGRVGPESTGQPLPALTGAGMGDQKREQRKGARRPGPDFAVLPDRRLAEERDLKHRVTQSAGTVALLRDSQAATAIAANHHAPSPPNSARGRLRLHRHRIPVAMPASTPADTLPIDALPCTMNSCGATIAASTAGPTWVRSRRKAGGGETE